MFRPRGRRLTISYRDQFNKQTGNSESVLNDRKLKKLDADFTVAAVMGIMEVEGGSIAGRLATGAAVQAERRDDLREKRKKEAAELIRIITWLRDKLAAIDERLEALQREIEALEIELTTVERESQRSFDRMHTLESILGEIEAEGLTDFRREQLRDAIGLRADKARDDDRLCIMADEERIKEQKNGMAASKRAEEIRKEIEDKKATRNELEQARQTILSDPNLSVEDKTAKLQEALDTSLAADLDGHEIEMQTESKRNANVARDEELVSETEDSDFDFDEDQEITITVKPDTPGLG